MKRIPTLHRKPMLLALALTGTVGIAGAAFAQQYPSTNPSAPSPATSPTNTGPTRSDATGAGMTSKSSAMPARNDSADAAWQKLGSKGYVTKDDVKGLGGFSFDSADANHDGRLTQDEFRRGWSTYSSNGGGAMSPSGTSK